MQFTYCRDWNDAQWAPIEPLTPAEAAARFRGDVAEPNQWFSVVARRAGVGDEGPVEFVLEVLPESAYVKVKFYELSHSLGLTFGFAKVDAARLFLDEIVEYTYPEDDAFHLESDATVIDASTYTADGHLQRTVDDTSKPTVVEEDYRDVDVSEHWEPIPEFGEWASLGRYKRS